MKAINTKYGGTLGRTRGYNQDLRGRFWLNIRKNLLGVREIWLQNRSPGTALEAPFLWIVKTTLDKSLANVLQGSVHPLAGGMH